MALEFAMVLGLLSNKTKKTAEDLRATAAAPEQDLVCHSERFSPSSFPNTIVRIQSSEHNPYKNLAKTKEK